MVFTFPEGGAAQVTFATRMRDVGFDSLLIAELIVELEHVAGTMMDLTPANRVDTFGDLCRALRPVPSFPDHG